MSYNWGTQMDSNQCILLRTQELPRSLILRKTPVLRHIFWGRIPVDFLSSLSPSTKMHENIFQQRPTKRGEIELLDPGHVVPILCELRNLATGFWCANMAKIHQVWTSKSQWCPKRTNFFGWGGGIPEFMMWTFFITPFDPHLFSAGLPSTWQELHS